MAAENPRDVNTPVQPQERRRAVAADVIAGVGWAALIVLVLLFSLSHNGRFIYAGF